MYFFVQNPKILKKPENIYIQKSEAVNYGLFLKKILKQIIDNENCWQFINIEISAYCSDYTINCLSWGAVDEWQRDFGHSCRLCERFCCWFFKISSSKTVSSKTELHHPQSCSWGWTETSETQIPVEGREDKYLWIMWTDPLIQIKHKLHSKK